VWQMGGEQIRSMLKAGRCVKLIMGVSEPQLLEHPLRAGIFRVMAGHQRAYAKRFKRIVHHGASGFGGKPLAPMLRSQLEAHFEGSGGWVVRAHSAATDVLPIRPAKQRPVLDAVPLLPLELRFQALAP